MASKLFKTKNSDSACASIRCLNLQHTAQKVKKDQLKKTKLVALGAGGHTVPRVENKGNAKQSSYAIKSHPPGASGYRICCPLTARTV